MISPRPFACAAAVLWSCLVTNAAFGQADDFPFDHSASVISDEELLPTGQEVCMLLGLDSTIPGRCNVFAALAMSGRQTDTSLWFVKAIQSSRLDVNCRDAVAFGRSKTSGGIEYLCRAPEEDVTITPAALSALAAEASRLNAVQHKTLAVHARALELKTELDCVTGRHVGDCD